MAEHSGSKGTAVATRLRKRPARRGPLSEAEVVAAALEIIKEGGAESLTMRRLSDDLGVALGATYKHVSNKQVLLTLVADELFARVEDTDPRDEEWLPRMHALFVRIYDTFRAYPGLADQVAHLPSQDPQPPHLHGTLVKLLADAGFSDPEVNEVMGALFFYTTGALLMDAPYPSQHSAAAFAAGLDFLLVGARELLEESARPRGARSAVPRTNAAAGAKVTRRAGGSSRRSAAKS
jgi:AcrR family transcriptional regulator